MTNVKVQTYDDPPKQIMVSTCRFPIKLLTEEEKQEIIVMLRMMEGFKRKLIKLIQ
jgi:hypothetical protein